MVDELFGASALEMSVGVAIRPDYFLVGGGMPDCARRQVKDALSRWVAGPLVAASCFPQKGPLPSTPRHLARADGGLGLAGGSFLANRTS